MISGLTAVQADRPIIFIAHSLGGLVAAQAFVFGERHTLGDAAQLIAQQLRGMIFLGTPFRGSTLAKPAEIARRILSVFGVNTQESTLKLLGVDSERLKILNVEFPEAMRKRISSKKPDDKIDAVFFYETMKTHGVQVRRQGCCNCECDGSLNSC
jgi:protein SERAC1